MLARSPQGKAQGREHQLEPEPQGDGTDPEKPRPASRLTYQWQFFRDISRELPPLFKRHWKEIALNQDSVPLDPDWDRYFQYDLIGILHCLTVRDGEALVGYVFVLVFPHLHYASTLWAQTDIFWLDPSYREGWTGYRMFRLMEKRLKELGIKVLSVQAKLHFEAGRGTIGKMFDRLGYAPVETVYSKVIG